MVIVAIIAVIAVIVTIVVIVNVSKSQSKKALREKYLNLPLTKKLAFIAGENALESINKANRSIYKKEISHYINVESYEDNFDKGKYRSIGGAVLYNFAEHNLRLLSRDEITALLWAIATLARQYVLNNLEKDPSGTRYTLSDVREQSMYVTGVQCSFLYTAPNGNYEAPKDW